MTMQYLDGAIAIISVAAPALGLLFNFYVSHNSIKLHEIQIMDALETVIAKEPCGKLTELNRENLERLRFKQATVSSIDQCNAL